MSQDHSSQNTQTAGRNSRRIQLWWERRDRVGDVSTPPVEPFSQRLSQWPGIEQWDVRNSNSEREREREGSEETSVNAQLYIYQDRLLIRQKSSSDGEGRLLKPEWTVHFY